MRRLLVYAAAACLAISLAEQLGWHRPPGTPLEWLVGGLLALVLSGLPE